MKGSSGTRTFQARPPFLKTKPSCTGMTEVVCSPTSTTNAVPRPTENLNADSRVSVVRESKLEAGQHSPREDSSVDRVEGGHFPTFKREFNHALSVGL